MASSSTKRPSGSRSTILVSSDTEVDVGKGKRKAEDAAGPSARANKRSSLTLDADVFKVSPPSRFSFFFLLTMPC